jgi:osmotically-inducible protein OsmY
MTWIGAWVGAITLALLGGACSERTQDNAAEVTRETREAADAAARATGEAVGETSAAVGAAVDEAGRAVGGALETASVKAALLADTRVDASGINVDTDADTKTVVLKGTVPTTAQKTIAEQIAMKHAAGYRVRNNLTVEPAR